MANDKITISTYEFLKRFPDKSRKDRQMTCEEASVSTAQVFEKEEINRGHRSNLFSQVRNQKIKLFLEQYSARRAAEDKTRHCFVGDPDRTAMEHTPGTALGGHNYTVYELDGQYLAEHVTVGACSIIGRTLALVDKSFLDKCLASGQVEHWDKVFDGYDL